MSKSRGPEITDEWEITDKQNSSHGRNLFISNKGLEIAEQERLFRISRGFAITGHADFQEIHEVNQFHNHTQAYVTGSGKRDIFAQTMIFQYKRCCSKKCNIIYYSKNFFLA